MIKSKSIISIAKHAGEQILIPNWGKVAREIKQDGSAITIIDKQVSKYIIGALKALTPDIPVVSEEATVEENRKALNSCLRWVVDPLDGTSTYLDETKRGKEAGFGVHIALINKGQSVKGACYFPAQKRLYYTGDDGNAYIQIDDNEPQKIFVLSTLKKPVIRAAVPWKDYKRPDNINGFDYDPVPTVGGEVLCKVACGEADLVWHDRPDKDQILHERDVFSHWDVAAAHAVLKAAGGELYEIATGKVVTYDDPSFHVPPCVAGHDTILKHIGFQPDQIRGQHNSNPNCAP